MLGLIIIQSILLHGPLRGCKIRHFLPNLAYFFCCCYHFKVQMKTQGLHFIRSDLFAQHDWHARISLKALTVFFSLKLPINYSTGVAGRRLMTREAKSSSENLFGMWYSHLFSKALVQKTPHPKTCITEHTTAAVTQTVIWGQFSLLLLRSEWSLPALSAEGYD